jgi:L-ascorbate metabolism protein UlaG (beta-lactamase superfamily)
LSAVRGRWPASWRLVAFGAAPAGARLRRVETSPQFTGGALRNSVPTRVVQPGADARALYVSLTGWRHRRPAAPIPTYPLSPAELDLPPASGLRLTWLGHSTVLADLDGARVLFDPVWSTRCSPVTWAGPRRHHPAPISLRDLPAPDVVVISHDHYDHLDMATVRFLARRTGAVFAVPLGVGAHLEHWQIPARRIIELDWHQATRIAGLTFTATPARHYCGRGLRQASTTLWCSWVVTGNQRRIFHCGDSGYFPGLAEIGTRYGPFTATMMPIGAYHQLWPDVHMTPEQAITAHHDLQGQVMLPMHWATFNIAPHPWAEPIDRLIAAARATATQITTPRPGQPTEPTNPATLRHHPWWRPALPPSHPCHGQPQHQPGQPTVPPQPTASDTPGRAHGTYPREDSLTR